MAIGWNEFRSLLMKTFKMVDQNFRPEDIDRLFVAINSNNNPVVKTKYNSSKGIIRYEFFEAMIKACIKRFFD